MLDQCEKAHNVADIMDCHITNIYTRAAPVGMVKAYKLLPNFVGIHLVNLLMCDITWDCRDLGSLMRSAAKGVATSRMHAIEATMYSAETVRSDLKLPLT